MYHSFKGLLSGAILTGLLFMSSEPVEASGYTIVVPTATTNLHEDVTHIMLKAVVSEYPTAVGLGVGVAVVNNDTGVNESIHIEMESIEPYSIFFGDQVMISINPCNTAPVITGANVIEFHNANLSGPTFTGSGDAPCAQANNGQPWTVMQSGGYSFPVSDLVPMGQ